MLDVWFQEPQSVSQNVESDNEDFCGQYIVNQKKLQANDNVFNKTSKRRWQKDASQVPNMGRIEAECTFFLGNSNDKQSTRMCFCGTGTIVDKNGMIVVTAAHVVCDYIHWVSCISTKSATRAAAVTPSSVLSG